MSDPERRIPYRSEIENFVKTDVWKYMAEEISAQMLQASIDNEELDPYKEPARMVRNQQIISMGKMILDMPAQLAEEADEQAQRDSKQREEEPEND